MKEEKASIFGLESNFKTKGNGLPLLILHGWGGSSDSWVNVIDILSRNYNVFCPDFPGFGKSVVPQKAWSLDDYMDWTIKLIDYLDIDKFYLIGHSFGARVAVKLSCKYPEKIKKLILCNPAGIKMKLNLFQTVIKLMAETGNSIFNFRYLKVFKDCARSIFYFFIRRKDYAKAKGIMKEVMKNVLKEDLSKCLLDINMPALIVWGKRDKIVPVEYAKVFSDSIKGSELIIMPDIGHSPHLEAPEELAKAILKFINL
ncbi:MAG: alpha/beta hydrolase [Candidatus Pacebacteria bacterium]|nr:alpha/beta hydrolase [Candidatus Paceibacterota bacterium]